jgi:hypothetical protein
MIDRRDIKYFIILLILNCVLFYKIILNPDGLFYPAMDLIRLYSPMENLISSSVYSFKELPLWNPYIFSGMPFVGNPLNLMFYPPNFIFIIFPNNSMFGLFVMFHIMLAGIFTYLFLRLLKIDRFPSFIGALIFMFSGIFVNRFALHGMIGNGTVICYVPVLFFFTELLLQKRKMIFAVPLGIGWTLQIFGGQPQNFLYANFALFIYIIMRLIFILKDEKLKNALKNIGYLALAFVIFLGISAVYIIPNYEVSKNSSETTISEESVTKIFLAPRDLLTFVSPNIYGSEAGYPEKNTYWGGPVISYAYIGFFSLLLVLFALLFCRTRYVWIFLTLSLFAVLFAFGILQQLPLFNIFRSPTKMLFIYVFSMSVLAGIGASFFTGKINKKQERILKITRNILIAGLIVGTLVLGVLLAGKSRIIDYGQSLIKEKYTESIQKGTQIHDLEYFIDRAELYYNQLILNLIFFSFLVIVSILLICYKIRKAMGKNIVVLCLLVVFLLVIDLFFYSLPNIETLKDSNEIFEKNDIIKFLEKDSSYFRIIDTTRTAEQELTVRSKIYKIDGYDALLLSEYNEFINLMKDENRVYKEHNIEVEEMKIEKIKNYNILNLLNTKYILTEEKVSNGNLIYVHNATVYVNRLGINRDVRVYENKNVLPRAFIVRNARVIKEEEISEYLKYFDAKKEVLLEEKIEESKTKNNGDFKEADIVFYSPNSIKVNITLEDPGFLVLSEIYYNGWKAYDDGKELKIMKGDYIFRTVYLQKGSHLVEFRYEPLSYKIGLIITLTSIVSVIVLLIFLRKFKK